MKEENKAQGFIVLFRSLLDWEWYQDANTMRVFIHCLLRANHQPKKWKGIVIPRGSFVGSIATLSTELNVSEKAIRTAIDHLKKTGELATKSTNKFTLYTVNNYDSYQDYGKQNGTLTASKGQASGKQRATNNNDNNENKGTNKTPIVPFDPFSIVSQSYTNPQVLEAWKGFIDMRSKLKGGKIASEHQLKLLMNALEKNARTDAERIDVINQSIMNGWKGLFPLKEKKNAANCTGYQNGDVSGAYDGYIPWDDYRGNV